MMRLLLLLLFSCPVYAELTPEHAWRIYLVAYGQHGGPPAWLEKSSMPIIHQVRADEICEALNDRPGCGAQGAYINGEKRILIDQALDFDTLYATAVLLHEYIHHFQYLRIGVPISCLDAAMRERQAYLIQADMLERGGEFSSAYMVMKSGLIRAQCPVEIKERKS